jgi:DNA-binding response OmpR family regulator
MIRNNARRVLVVDDEPSVREMLSDFLEMNNFICMQADNGASAMDVTKREKFDLIIMDVRMPGVSGIEALREIKRQSPSQAVVMVTAVSEVETAVEAMRLGANDYVMKPFVLRDMLTTVDHAIQSTPSNAAAIATEFETEEAPLTIAIGVPIEDEVNPDVDREELGRIAEEIMTIQDHLAAVLSRVDALSRPQRRAVASLSRGWHPGGDAA